MEIKIKYLREIPVLVSYGNWIDLYCAEDIILEKGEYKLIPLGIAVELPEQWEAIIAPRSSTFKNYGIIMTNSIGVIDTAYCGDNDEWHYPAYATRLTKICKGDRIAQFRILPKMGGLSMTKVETLGNEDRGGIGSTGR